MFGRTLSYDEMLRLAAGQPVAPGPVVPSAERRMAYNPEVMAIKPEAMVKLDPAYINRTEAKMHIANQKNVVTPVDKTDYRYQNVIDRLGADWEQQQQAAAERGDWAEYNRITNIVTSIMSFTETGE